MNRNITSAFLAASLCLPVLAQPILAKLDGRALQFDQPPVMMGGRVMVPLRGIFESLGANVRFEAASQKIHATRGSNVVELTLGSTQASVDGKSVNLDSPAATIGGRTMVPLRFVSEALGTEVRWQEATQTVFLTTSGAVADSPAPAPAPPRQPSQPLQLNSVNHNARGSIKGGDRLVVSASGTRGGKASFDILGVVNNQPMREAQPGEYRGNFTVPNLLRVSQGTLVVHLRKQGQTTQQEAQRPVTFNAQQQPGAPGRGLDISRVNLRNGQGVRPLFDVQGQTMPGATVQITGRSPRIPGTVQAQGRADGNGRFSIQVNANAVPDNAPLNLTILAVDPNGRQGAPRQLQLIRR